VPTISRFFGISIAMYFEITGFRIFMLAPDITAVSVVRHGVLDVSFADGLAGEVDVLDRMRGPVFEKARTASGFTAVSVDPESGTVVWPGGGDLVPDTLYQRVNTRLWPEQKRRRVSGD
jgi:hypothetical protein